MLRVRIYFRIHMDSTGRSRYCGARRDGHTIGKCEWAYCATIHRLCQWKSRFNDGADMVRIMTNRGREHQSVGSPAKNCRACAIYRSRLSSSLRLLSRPRPLDEGAQYTPDWKGGGTILVSAPASYEIRVQPCKLSNTTSYKSSCMNRCEVNEEQSPR